MKLFSRMTIVINNRCNQNCEWCFEGKWKEQQEQNMSLSNVERLLKWKNWEDGQIPGIYIMGGEPTLHPQLLDMIHLIKSYNKRISIFLLTNLNCSRKLLETLIENHVILCANVDQFESSNNVKAAELIRDNIRYLNNISTPAFQYNITATVSEPEKDFEFLYNILKEGKGNIYNLRLAHSSVGYGLDNKFPQKDSDGYFQKILEVIQQCKRIKPDIHLSTECAINGCLINETLYHELSTEGYHLQYECGCPEPNADILPDMSAHWCFPFEERPDMKISNVFEYPDYNKMLDALYEKAKNFVNHYGPGCNKGKCKHKKCQGLCPALIYYKKMKENNLNV